MSWIHGPLNDHDLVLGLQVFWLKRLVAIAQLIFGSLILTNLIGDARKRQLHSTLQEAAEKAKSVKPYRRWRKGRVIAWVVIALVAVSTAVAGLQSILNGTPFSLRLIALYFVLLSFIAAPLTFAVWQWTDMILTVLFIGKRHVPPLAASLLHYERFDRNVILVSFVGLVTVSVAQLLLS